MHVVERFNRTIKDEVTEHDLLDPAEFVKKMTTLCAGFSSYGQQAEPNYTFDILPHTPKHVSERNNDLWCKCVDFKQEESVSKRSRVDDGAGGYV